LLSAIKSTKLSQIYSEKMDGATKWHVELASYTLYLAIQVHCQASHTWQHAQVAVPALILGQHLPPNVVAHVSQYDHFPPLLRLGMALSR